MIENRIRPADTSGKFFAAVSAVLILCSVGFFAIQSAHAAGADRAVRSTQNSNLSKQRSDLLDEWIESLDKIEKSIGSTKTLPDEYNEYLVDTINEIYRDAKAALDRDDEIIQKVRLELDSLGPAPAADAPAETSEMADLRQRLLDRFARVDERLRKARLVRTRAENLYSTIKLREANLAEQLFTRSPSLFEGSTWREAGSAYVRIFAGMAASPQVWWESAKNDFRIKSIIPVLFSGILAVFLIVPARRWLLRKVAKRLAGDEMPSEGQRAIHAAKTVFAQAILPTAGFALLAITIYTFAPENLMLSAMVVYFFFCCMIFFAITGPAKAALAPHDPKWRMLPVTEKGAHALVFLTQLIAVCVALGYFLKWTIEFGATPSPEAYATFRLFFTTIFASLTLLTLSGAFWLESKSTSTRTATILIRGVIAIGLAAVPILDFAGYSTLAAFVLSRLLVTVVALAGLTMMLPAVHELLAKLLRILFEKWLLLRQGSANLTLFWLKYVLDFCLFGALIHELIIFYGLPRELLNRWLAQVLTGVKIGEVTISVTEILLAILVFMIGLLLTGWIKRRTTKALTSRIRMDVGVRESIVSGIGYFGVSAALLLAVLALGFDFSNFALVAGALSVGVGFGLKAVVENFAAGIILLVERPIKAGDWIITGDREGIVQRISVRSTEVETFDRSSVIVPNSELIAQSVENWTHTSKTARVSLPVGVAYGSDTAKVHEVLLACAEAHDMVLKYPKPIVLFRAFGDSSLNFELRCFIANAHQRINVSSDLHFSVDAAFREAGIEIAFPQRDLHIRDAVLGEIGT